MKNIIFKAIFDKGAKGAKGDRGVNFEIPTNSIVAYDDNTIPEGFIETEDPTSGIQPILINKNITQNGVYIARNDSADGFAEVDVNVEGDFNKIKLSQNEYNALTYTEKIDSSKIYFITPPSLFNWDFKNSTTDTESGRTATLVGATWFHDTGVDLYNVGDYIDLGNIDINDKTIEIDIGVYAPDNISANMYLLNLIRNNGYFENLLYYDVTRYNNIELGFGTRIYNDSAGMYKAAYYSNGNALPRDSIRNKTIKIKCENTNNISLWVDDVFIRTANIYYNYNYDSIRIGSLYNQQTGGTDGNCQHMIIKGVRVYG